MHVLCFADSKPSTDLCDWGKGWLLMSSHQKAEMTDNSLLGNPFQTTSFGKHPIAIGGLPHCKPKTPVLLLSQKNLGLPTAIDWNGHHRGRGFWGIVHQRTLIRLSLYLHAFPTCSLHPTPQTHTHVHMRVHTHLSPCWSSSDTWSLTWKFPLLCCLPSWAQLFPHLCINKAPNIPYYGTHQTEIEIFTCVSLLEFSVHVSYSVKVVWIELKIWCKF